MPVQLLRLRGVLEDEADEIRALLRTHGIDYYETPPGNWGISMPALWLPDATRLEEARALLARYQAERTARVRAEYRRAVESGEYPTFLGRLRASPWRVIGALALIGVVLWFSTRPFLGFSQ